MENLKIYLLSVHRACSCFVERKEDGTIVPPDLNGCIIVQDMHREAIADATSRLKALTKEGK